MVNNIPAGTWQVDATHSEVGFSVKHLMISKVKGRFKDFEGTFVTGENPLEGQVNGKISVASVDTNDSGRDGHLQSGDFFDAENYPTIDFVSTKITADGGDDFTLEGTITIHGVSQPITLKGEFGGVTVDGYGQTKAAAELKGKLSRGAHGLTWNSTLEKGGVLVSDDVTLTLDIQAVLQS